MIDLIQRQTLILNFPCFAKFSKQESLELAKLMTESLYHKGDVIVTEGDLVDSVYLIAEGAAEVTHEIENKETKKSELIAVLRSGEAIGLNELGFFSTTGLRTATVTAQTDMTLLRLTVPQLDQFLQHNPQLNQTMGATAKQMLRMDLIKEAAPFRELPRKVIYWLAQCVEERKYEKNEVIFREGDESNGCYLIFSGKVDIFITNNEDVENILVKLEKPALFGEIALLTSAPRNATARASEPTTLLMLHKEDFLELMTHEKGITDALTPMMLERARPRANKKIIIHQRQAADGETIVTLKNSEHETYYELSKEGWFVYQHLNGKNTVKDIIIALQKEFNIFMLDFVYELIMDLVNGGFANFSPEKKGTPRITVISYDAHEFVEATGISFEECFPIQELAVTWVNVEGSYDLNLVSDLAKQYDLHPLTVEDILNVEHRPKVEIFDNYVFVTLKALTWNNKLHKYSSKQINLVLGKNYVLSFQESESNLFSHLRDYLHTRKGRQMREHGADYLIYRLIDTIVDEYYVVLEGMGEQIEKTEEMILSTATPQNARSLYRLKRQMVMLRKAVWPVREAVNHLLHHTDSELVSSYSTLYLRDLYDHLAQAIDTIETYRDIIGGLLDAYLSTLSIRMNEIMKVLTIIATIFIPITFLAGLFGMNFIYMPGLHWHWGYYTCLGIMSLSVLGLLIFFKRKKWI